MSLTFTPSQPHAKVGPGLAFQIVSDASAHTTIDHWSVQVYQTVSPFANVVSQIYQQSGGVLSARLGYSPGQGIQLSSTTDLFSDDTATLYAFAYDHSNTLVDFGNFSITWEGQEGIGQLISLLPQTTGGLTSGEVTTLNETHDYAQAALSAQTFSVVTPTATTQYTLADLLSGAVEGFLGLNDVGGGVTCDPIVYDASAKVIAHFVVTIASYPEWWFFTTPDNAWSPKDLAVISIKRGGQEVLRQGVHTLSHTINDLPSIPRLPFTNNFLATPEDYIVYVDWAEGVCGHLFAYALP